MRTILFSILVASLVFMVACNPANKTKQADKWSVRMANTVIEQYDSLVNYLNADESKKWQYDVAMLGGAIDKLGYIDPKYSEYLKTYVDYFVDEHGNIFRYQLEEYNIDRINPGKNLLTLYKRTGEERYKTAFMQLVEQMKTHPKTESGGYWHKKIYPNQLWLDGIYMASPFLAQYAKEYNDPQWFDVVAHQITNIYKKTLDEKTGLLYHAVDESREMQWSDPETGHSPHFWSRAMGWYLMAIVDVLDYLPEDHPNRHEIQTILKNTIDALLNVADPNTGLWYQVIDHIGKEGNYIEASGSIMYTYAMAKGANKGYLDDEYLAIANTKFDSVIKNLIDIDENGHLILRNTCGGCGLGGNPYRDGNYQYYITEKVVLNDTKGVGPFILAAIELDR
jgi:unsaturated rhamnogalacturonyl hydrolase